MKKEIPDVWQEDRGIYPHRQVGASLNIKKNADSQDFVTFHLFLSKTNIQTFFYLLRYTIQMKLPKLT